MIIIVALFKKKNDFFFFRAVKAADNIPGDLLPLSRGEIAAFQRLRNDAALQLTLLLWISAPAQQHGAEAVGSGLPRCATSQGTCV